MTRMPLLAAGALVVALAALGVAIGALVSNGGSSGTTQGSGPTPVQGDVVVNVILRCTVLMNQQAGVANDGKCERQQRISDDGGKTFRDENADGAVILDAANEVTVRTPQGTTYAVTVPPDRNVQVGQPWPQ